MRRVVSLWFPMLPTDRLRHVLSDIPHDTPLITVSRKSRRRIVVAADRIARDFGIEAGMPVTHAQALIPDLICIPSHPLRDAQTVRDLAAWAIQYAPQTSPVFPDGIWIDATGSTHLHGGEWQMLDEMVTRLEKAGLHTQAAIADTPGAAHAAAGFSGHRVSLLPPGETVTALADFPLAALRLSEEAVFALQQLGFSRIGQIIGSPRPTLAQRLGTELQQRLDQARGDVFEPISPVSQCKMIRAQLTFAEPLLTTESLHFVMGVLIERIIIDLEQAGLGARKFGLCLDRVDGSLQFISVNTTKASRNSHHLARLLRERVDRIDPGLGIEAARLTVFLAESLTFSQVGWNGIVPYDNSDLPSIVDCLANRIGVERIYRMIPAESDFPERAAKLSAPLDTTQTNWIPLLSRPTRLLAPPQRVEAITAHPDQPLLAFVWHRTVHRVRLADGPERIAGEWWKSDAELRAKRDYFAVEDESGRRYWLFRQENRKQAGCGDFRWFLHGLF